MGIKNVVVIVDDFSSTYLSLVNDYGYGIETYDYGVATGTAYAVSPSDGSTTYIYGDETHELFGPLYTYNDTGVYSFWDENLDADDLNDGPQAPILIGYDPQYNEDIYLDITSTILSASMHTPDWEHGDVVAKAFYEQLDNPDDTYVLAIDWDYTNTEYDFLFTDVDGDGNTVFEEIVQGHLDDKSSMWPDNQFNLIGYSFSWGDTNGNPDLYDDLFPLLDVDTPIFTFAEPNTSQIGQPWNNLFEDIIAGGAWNVTADNYSLIANFDHIDEVDILANGLVEQGYTSSSSAWYDPEFGTSYATPRIMAEVVNFYETYIYPLLDTNYASIAEVWGSIVDPSEGYSGIVDHIIDAITTTVEVLFEGQSDFKTFNVMTSDLDADGTWPSALAGVYFEGTDQDGTTPKILDVRVVGGDSLYLMDYNILANPMPGSDDDLFEFVIFATLSDYAGVDEINTSVEIYGTDPNSDLIFRIPVKLTPAPYGGQFGGIVEAPADLFDSIPNPDDIGSFGVSLAGTEVVKSDGSTEHAYINPLEPDPTLYIGNDMDNLVGWTLETNPVTVVGAGGDDVLFGGLNNSMIDGGPGNDAIYPNGGLNSVWGGSGNDIILSGTGGGDFFGGKDDDTFFVNQGGALTNVDPYNTLNGSPVVLGFVEGVLGDGNNIAVLSVGKKFETPITAHPALVGTTIGEMAWGEFSVSINGVEQIVGLSPDLFANGQVTPTSFESVDGVTILATALPSALNGVYVPSDPNTHVVDLYIQAVDDLGNSVPLPAGTEVSFGGYAQIGELGFDAAGQPALINPTQVEWGPGFPDTFYTAQVADGFVYDDGTRLKKYYVNGDKTQLAYETENEGYSFYGNQGQDTIRFTVPQDEFSLEQGPDGVTYTHNDSGNYYYVHKSVENVIFDGVSEIVNPAAFLTGLNFNVGIDGGFAALQVEGYADLSKLAGSSEFELQFQAQRLTENGSWFETFPVSVSVDEIGPDGSFSIYHIEPGITQGGVSLVGAQFNGANGTVSQIIKDADGLFGSPDATTSIALDIIDLSVVFDPETGQPSIQVTGNIANHEEFHWAEVFLSIGREPGEYPGEYPGDEYLSLQIRPENLDGSDFAVELDAATLGDLFAQFVNSSQVSPLEIDVSTSSEVRLIDTNMVQSGGVTDTQALELRLVTNESGTAILEDGKVYIGLEGDDRFFTEFTVPGDDAVSEVTIASGDGADRLQGTIGDDTLYAGKGDDFIQASDGQDIIYAGAGNDIYRVTNLPSEVDISQGAKMVDMTAAISFAGNVIVGATLIGPDADEPDYLELGISYNDPNGIYGSGDVTTGLMSSTVVSVPIDLADGTTLVAVLTETGRLAGKDAAEGLAAYSVVIFDTSGGDVPAGLEFSFSGTSINGSSVTGLTGPLIVPAADDPILQEIQAKNLWSYEGDDAVYDTHSSQFDGGSGYDTVYFYGSSDDFAILEENGRITVTHIASSRTDVLHRVEKLVFIDGSSIEEMLFDPFSDYQKIDGGDGDDILIGGAGKSYISAGGGSDIIRDEGGEDYVHLSGASGTVDIDLGIDDDVIRIGGDFTGNVALSGGAGNDILEIEGGFSGLEREGNDLKITLADGSVITIANQFDDFGNVHELYGIGLIKNVTVADDGSETSAGIALDPYFGDQADFTQIILTEDSPFIDIPWDENRLDSLNIIGSSTSDLVESGSGDDLIIGNNGHDFIHGNSGDDEIHGGVGDDVLIGGIGADKIFGGTGDDLIVIDFFKDGFFSETDINEYGSPSAWAPGGLDVVQDVEGVDTLMLDGSLMADPLGAAFYELVDGALTISASVSDVYHSLAITEMVSDQWFRQEPAGYDEDGQPNFGMTTEEVLALDIFDIETWPGFFDLDAASQEFYRAYFDPSLDSAELLARLNSAAAHVYANVDNTRHHTPPVADAGNYPLYLSEEHANGAMEGDGTSHPMIVNGMTYWMPNGVENHFHGDLPSDYDFESDDYGVWTSGGYYPDAPTSGDPSGTVADQMPFLFTTALAYGNVIDISGEYGDAMQGVVVEDASQIEVILEVSDELAWDVLDAKLNQIMAEDPPPIMVGPDQWTNNGYKTKELANGFYSSNPTHWNRFSIEQQGDDVVLIYTHPKQGVKKLWQGSADSVTHFEFYGGETLAVSDFVELPSGGMTAAEAAAVLVPWAVEEGYMKEYYLDPDGIATGSDEDHLLIGDWANFGKALEIDPDYIYPYSNYGFEFADILFLQGGAGDDKLVAASGELDADQILYGGSGDDTIVITADNSDIAALGGEGIDKFYVMKGSFSEKGISIYADEAYYGFNGVLTQWGDKGVNTDFGDAVFFDWAFQQENISRLENGGIEVSDGFSSVTVHDAEYLFFRDENGEYERFATTFGEVITSAMWSDSGLASNFDNLDPSLFTFSVDFDTYVNGIQTDKLILEYDGVEAWSGDRWSVDKFELPQDTYVNVVNVREEDALTGEVFDPNSFTTEGIDLIFGDDNVNIINAKGGNDIIFAGAGDDVIIGGDGDDLIFGDDGDDILRGDGLLEDDIAESYFSDDFLIEGSPLGDDIIEGGAGRDDLAAGDGSDALAADSFDNIDLDGDGLTSDTLSDIAGFNPFDESEDVV